MKQNAIAREARRVTKWNKRRLNKAVRRKAVLPSGKGGYKRTSFCALLHTMA